ncbi:hypothetical protein LTR34_001779, partial [Exophiala xenobiotica]
MGSCRLAIRQLKFGSGLIYISSHKNADCPDDLIYPILYPISNDQVGLCWQTSASVILLEEYVRSTYGSITQAIPLNSGEIEWLIVPKVKLGPVV